MAPSSNLSPHVSFSEQGLSFHSVCQLDDSLRNCQALICVKIIWSWRFLNLKRVRICSAIRWWSGSLSGCFCSSPSNSISIYKTITTRPLLIVMLGKQKIVEANCSLLEQNWFYVSCRNPSEHNTLLECVAFPSIIKAVLYVLLICEGREKFNIKHTNNAILHAFLEKRDSFLFSTWKGW